ncbi:MAG: Rha family transcriptional regulator [Candidatus Woesearchaeota archaeon]
MNQIVEQQLTLTSREVAEMIGIKHWEILRKLEGNNKRKGYIEILTNNHLVVSNYFIRSSYIDDSGKENKCYLFTKMGCEFLANKFTGEKGILFTAKYVEKFNQMKNQLEPRSEFDILRKMIDQLEVTQRDASEAKQIAQSIKDTILQTDEDWRNWVNNQLNNLCIEHQNYRDLKKQSYDILENRANCRLSIRLQNLKDRMLKAGATKTAANKACKLDVIEADVRLKEIYSGIVKDMVIKYS